MPPDTRNRDSLLRRGERPAYRMGCAGMFVLGTDAGYDDLDQALVAAGEIKAAFVYGPRGEADKCYGPFDGDDVEAAKARLAARNACVACGGRGRRSSWVNELGRDVEARCPDCAPEPTDA